MLSANSQSHASCTSLPSQHCHFGYHWAANTERTQTGEIMAHLNAGVSCWHCCLPQWARSIVGLDLHRINELIRTACTSQLDKACPLGSNDCDSSDGTCPQVAQTAAISTLCQPLAIARHVCKCRSSFSSSSVLIAALSRRLQHLCPHPDAQQHS